MKTIYVEVKVTIEDDFDAYEVIQECDYSFTGDGIISTEITQVNEANPPNEH